PGGVVVERALADALRIDVGDRVTLDGHQLRVVGIGVTAAGPVYSQVGFYGGCSGPGGHPRSFDTGLVWVTQAAAGSLATAGNPLTYYLSLRLAHPPRSPAVLTAPPPRPCRGVARFCGCPPASAKHRPGCADVVAESARRRGDAGRPGAAGPGA